MRSLGNVALILCAATLSALSPSAAQSVTSTRDRSDLVRLVVAVQDADYRGELAGIGALHQRYDTEIFPSAANVTSVTFSLSFPIWNSGQREIEVSRARVARDVARTIREDLERVVRRDVTSAFDTYQTSRAAVALARVGAQVGRENYRMQEMRYRAGASTILDLLDSQVDLAEAEADLVGARYETRLALARLEAILGRRLFSNKDAP